MAFPAVAWDCPGQPTRSEHRAAADSRIAFAWPRSRSWFDFHPLHVQLRLKQLDSGTGRLGQGSQCDNANSVSCERQPRGTGEVQAEPKLQCEALLVTVAVIALQDEVVIPRQPVRSRVRG